MQNRQGDIFFATVADVIIAITKSRLALESAVRRSAYRRCPVENRTLNTAHAAVQYVRCGVDAAAGALFEGLTGEHTHIAAIAIVVAERQLRLAGRRAATTTAWTTEARLAPIGGKTVAVAATIEADIVALARRAGLGCAVDVARALAAAAVVKVCCRIDLAAVLVDLVAVPSAGVALNNDTRSRETSHVSVRDLRAVFVTHAARVRWRVRGPRILRGNVGLRVRLSVGYLEVTRPRDQSAGRKPNEKREDRRQA